MSFDIKVPELGESIIEATIAKWLKKSGESVLIDEPLVELETEKVTLEVVSPVSGLLKEQLFQTGDTVKPGSIIGSVEEKIIKNEIKVSNINNFSYEDNNASGENEVLIDTKPAPSANKLIVENNLDLSTILGSGKRGQILKEDVINTLNSTEDKVLKNIELESNKNLEKIVPLNKLRQTIATRLKNVQNTAAILTTFNEVDMSEIIMIKEKHKESFYDKFGVKLGYMGFFVKACIDALREYPIINSEIKDNNIIYKNYYNIGIAVGTDRGLCVPVIKNAQNLSIPNIEKNISKLSGLARNNKLPIKDMQEGTFTITNGGVYGSLMSTPILNAPQSAILGMHKIEKRPVVINEKIEIRSMMYLALSYDHRIIDGAQAIIFLEHIKKSISNPIGSILDIF